MRILKHKINLSNNRPTFYTQRIYREGVFIKQDFWVDLYKNCFYEIIV